MGLTLLLSQEARIWKSDDHVKEVIFILIENMNSAGRVRESMYCRVQKLIAAIF